MAPSSSPSPRSAPVAPAPRTLCLPAAAVGARLMLDAYLHDPASTCGTEGLRNAADALYAATTAPPGPADDPCAELVRQFGAALYAKLHEAQRKYGYNNAWQESGWMEECRRELREHVEKGDPRDVAAYCAFLWWHREGTTPGYRPPGAEGAPAGPADDPEATHDVLLMTGERVSIEQVRAWTPAGRAEVDAWAGAVCLVANDHDDVVIPPRPAVLGPAGGVAP